MRMCIHVFDTSRYVYTVISPTPRPERCQSLISLVQDPEERERKVYRILDGIGFNWPVFWAVSVGFLASSYSLFAMGIMSPALLYVYDSHARIESVSEVLDLATLSSTVVGMLFFGHLADRGGRKRLYGWELIIIILATMGLVLSSEGYMSGSQGQHSMDIYASIIFFRCVLGFGIGAEYPVSAVIAAEFSSTDTRATMMAAIFLMQSIGRLLASGIGLAALRGIMGARNISPDLASDMDIKVVVDQVWRIVIGMGGVLALAALGLRLMIPESPRYHSGIRKDLNQAARAVKYLGGDVDAGDLRSDLSASSNGRDAQDARLGSWTQGAIEYLKRGGWKHLAGISVIWLLFDVCFYGTSLDSPGTLDALWLSQPGSGTQLPDWNDDHGSPNLTVQQILDNNATRILTLSSIASLAGSLLIIPLVHFANRRRLLIGTSLVLFLLFIATGTSVWLTYGKPNHAVGMVFFALTQFMYNLGPNTLTFIIAAEIFPTVFRGTFYGFAAAMGKIGAIVIRLITESKGKGREALTAYMFVFSGIMLTLAVIAFVPGIVPEVQHDSSRRAASADAATEAADDSSLQTRDRDGSVEEGWRARLPSRWKNKTLEEIASYPRYDEMPIAQEHSMPEAEHASPGAGRASIDNELLMADLTPVDKNMSDTTRVFETDLTSRFYPSAMGTNVERGQQQMRP